MYHESRIVAAAREMTEESLDAMLAFYVAHEDADKCVWNQAYVRKLYEAEQARRRDDQGDNQQYPHADLLSWPTDQLTLAATLAAGALEWIYQVNKPTLMSFAVEYNRVIVSVLNQRLIATGT